MLQRRRPTAQAAQLGRRVPGLQAASVAALLGACATAPGDSGTSRAYDMESERLYDRTLRALQASGLEVAETDRRRGVILAVGRFDERGWTECPSSLRLVQDQEERQHMVEAAEAYREVELRASVADGPEGARLTLEPTFVTEPASPLASTEACTTTGALERQIFDAVAAPA